MTVFTRAMACGAAGVLVAGSASAQFFTDGLDDLTAWTVANQADAQSAVSDYSAVDLNALFGVGTGTVVNIPEAPNMVAGSGATTGAIFVANTSAGAGSAANLIGAVAGDNADLNLPEYQVQFDMWLNVAVPIPGGGTEQGLWGVGRTTTAALGRNNRAADGDGTWGWIATENGYGTEDTAVFEGTTELADLGDTQAGEDAPFNAAFTTNFGVNNAPGNSWVTVTLAVDNANGTVGVWYNGVEFFNVATAATAGDVMLGYEDPFGSISAGPDFQFGVIDNVIIDDQITIPEPATAALLGLGGLAMLRRRV